VILIALTTPFGDPSGPYVTGTLRGQRVAFLSRHGVGHRLLPSELNFRANIHGFKQLGVERIVSLGAGGSLQQQHPPLKVVITDQFFDHRLCSELPAMSVDYHRDVRFNRQSLFQILGFDSEEGDSYLSAPKDDNLRWADTCTGSKFSQCTVSRRRGFLQSGKHFIPMFVGPERLQQRRYTFNFGEYQTIKRKIFSHVRVLGTIPP